MFWKSSRSERDAAAGREDTDAELGLEEFPPPFRRKPGIWVLAKLGIKKGPSDKDRGGREDDDFAEDALFVKKALRRIDNAGFYTLDAVRQLAVKHFKAKAEENAQKAEQTRKTLATERLGPEQRAEGIRRCREARRAAAAARHAERMFKNRHLTDKLERYKDSKSPAFPSRAWLTNMPSKDVIVFLHEFFEESGFLDNPAPVRYLLRDKLLTTVMVNTVKDLQDRAAQKAGAQGGVVADEQNHFFYHAVRSEIGGRGVRLRYELLEKAEKVPNLIPGAVYTTYIYDEPYLKKGVFVIYPRRPNDPARVKFLSRWQSPVTRPVGAAINGPVTSRHNQSAPSRAATFVEEQKGYIFDQGFDFYIYLFGPDEYKSPPSSERTRRISTIYVDGSNRSGPVMNKIMGSIIAFDSGPKGEIMFQRVVMYRYGEPIHELDADQMDKHIEQVLNESRRFDINEPLELTREEGAYREIFMDLGFEATEVKDPEDDRRRLEVRRIIQPISDQSPMEIIFDR